MNIKYTKKKFINREKLYNLLKTRPPTKSEVNKILNKSLNLKGLELNEVAKLLQIENINDIKKIIKIAQIIKNKIYGNRLVLFAPLYLSNFCQNNCLYCGFRKENKDLVRKKLNKKEIILETEMLLKQGHKRLLVLTGEDEKTDIDYLISSIKLIYGVRYKNNFIRRINVEVAPLSVRDFKKLKNSKIGTYVCFQETYDEINYKKFHPSGKKSDYFNRLYVMDRAMLAGIKDVGIGVLFGLSDYKFEVLALIEHSKYLEKNFNCGPHTISVPRIEPAKGAPLSYKIPNPVSDKDFKKLVAILRISVPYTGIILSTRETKELRNELFNYGVSQISAGSRTNPGSYSKKYTGSYSAGAQFALGDHRSLKEVVSDLIDMKHIPSFCTACYRKGRIGKDFMDLAKPGLIQKFCQTNGIITFYEYLIEFTSDKIKDKGEKLIKSLIRRLPQNTRLKTLEILKKIKNGKRDIYL